MAQRVGIVAVGIAGEDRQNAEPDHLVELAASGSLCHVKLMRRRRLYTYDDDEVSIIGINAEEVEAEID